MEFLDLTFFDWITFGHAWHLKLVVILFVTAFIISFFIFSWMQGRYKIFAKPMYEGDILPFVKIVGIANFIAFLLFRQEGPWL